MRISNFAIRDSRFSSSPLPILAKVTGGTRTAAGVVSDCQPPVVLPGQGLFTLTGSRYRVRSLLEASEDNSERSPKRSESAVAALPYSLSLNR